MNKCVNSSVCYEGGNLRQQARLMLYDLSQTSNRQNGLPDPP